MEEKNTTFHYTYDYSAKQQAEIKKIRERYIPRQENKMEQLHRLDASAKKSGKMTAIIDGHYQCLAAGGRNVLLYGLDGAIFYSRYYHWNGWSGWCGGGLSVVFLHYQKTT